MAADPAFAAKRREQKRAGAARDRERNAEKRRIERMAAGPTYTTDAPCVRGHVGPRYSANQTCVECAVEDAAAFELRRAERMLIDPDFRVKRRAQKNATSSKWRKAHRGEKSAEWAAWYAARLQRTPPWADLKRIRGIYEEAHRATKLTGLGHHVDHIIPLQGELVSGLHVAENLRVLPGPENLSKGSKFDP